MSQRRLIDVLKSTPRRRQDNASTNNTPEISTTGTRKRAQIDYQALHNYGTQGPLTSPTPSAPRTTKKRRLELFQASQQSTITVEVPDDEEEDAFDLEKSKKKSWFWQYFSKKELATTYEKGRGRKKKTVKDEEYACTIHNGAKCGYFKRIASKLHSSTGALSGHLEQKHQIFKETDPKTARSGNPTALQKWVNSKDDNPTFDEALIDWVAFDCQAFTVTESEWFRRMMKAAGCIAFIPKGDAIANKIHARVLTVEKNTSALLDRTCATIAISLDGWTSQNGKSYLAINGTWLGPDFMTYKACLEFIQIKGSHSGENLAETVYKTGKQFSILQKIITITGDNASNNDTLCRHLYQRLSRKFDDYMEEHPIRGEPMRFQGEQSQIRCFAHILNLVCKAILKSLGSSTHKDAVGFLDRVENKWDKITIPGALGDIAILRLVVLWIARSPQRQLEWDNRENSKKRIPYDVDTRWNYTVRMIEDAFENRAALEDTIKDHPELGDLTLTTEHWYRLTQIRSLLKPFDDFTKWVSRRQPTLHMSASLYLKLEKLLTDASQRQGDFASIENNLALAAKTGLDKFKDYHDYMKANNIYYIAAILDPRIKTNWLKKNVINANKVIKNLNAFLKKAYPREPELPNNTTPPKKKSLELEFLEEYASTVTVDNDIDRYLDASPVTYVLNEKEDQTQWILDWWKANGKEFPCMAAVARDFLPIPASEVDVETLFSLGRDILGIRRYSLSGDTMRDLMLLKDALRRQKVRQI